jgi:hypothetical protein
MVAATSSEVPRANVPAHTTELFACALQRPTEMAQGVGSALMRLPSAFTGTLTHDGRCRAWLSGAGRLKRDPHAAIL